MFLLREDGDLAVVDAHDGDFSGGVSGDEHGRVLAESDASASDVAAVSSGEVDNERVERFEGEVPEFNASVVGDGSKRCRVEM